jgi:hypothetical protein
VSRAQAGRAPRVRQPRSSVEYAWIREGDALARWFCADGYDPHKLLDVSRRTERAPRTLGRGARGSIENDSKENVLHKKVHMRSSGMQPDVRSRPSRYSQRPSFADTCQATRRSIFTAVQGNLMCELLIADCLPVCTGYTQDRLDEPACAGSMYREASAAKP